MNNNFKSKKTMASKSKHCSKLCSFKNHSCLKSEVQKCKTTIVLAIKRFNYAKLNKDIR